MQFQCGFTVVDRRDIVVLKFNRRTPGFNLFATIFPVFFKAVMLTRYVPLETSASLPESLYRPLAMMAAADGPGVPSTG